ncbi:UV excision repair protein [Arthroderma uncinatum]|uniref:UV excision repair protein n=1 Tax=Arthroderma uncinatum TaxID=74035 RepID=UPI00144A9AE3|nr:UV excision repair protein [Arthroderma uncinatum]KAF3479439.1 UV excision repair protein [Arthroderma uncinatum]
MVVPKTKWDRVGWVKKLEPNWVPFIYSVDNDLRYTLRTPKNVGREAMVYLTFIIDYYDSLPDIVAFTHSANRQWHNDVKGLKTVTVLSQLQIDAVKRKGYVNLRCLWEPGCPTSLNPLNPTEIDIQRQDERAKMPEIYMQLFNVTRNEVPEHIGGVCCAQFAVTRERIRARSREDYIRMRNWALEYDLTSFSIGWVFEQLWHIIFMEEAIHLTVYLQLSFRDAMPVTGAKKYASQMMGVFEWREIEQERMGERNTRRHRPQPSISKVQIEVKSQESFGWLLAGIHDHHVMCLKGRLSRGADSINYLIARMFARTSPEATKAEARCVQRFTFPPSNPPGNNNNDTLRPVLFSVSGKILQDANTIESYNIEEKGFIVCMVSKPKPAPSASGSAASSSSQTPAAPPSAPIPATPSAPARANVTASETPATPSPAGGAASGATFNDPSALLMGNQGQEAITQMEAMGFPRSDIDRAMRAAFFNPDRAIEYLLNGIPEESEREPPSAPPAGSSQAPPVAAGGSGGATDSQVQESLNLFEQAAAQAGGGGAGRGRGAGAGEGAGSLGNLEFLRNNPHFQQLRQLVQQQPQMLEPILQQVGAGNPQLAQLIGQNQEQFLQLLSEDIDDETQIPPGAQSISVTEEERDAIERLCRLGFPRDSVIQAYFACDKNEELAANFLFDQPDEGEDQQ